MGEELKNKYDEGKALTVVEVKMVKDDDGEIAFVNNIYRPKSVPENIEKEYLAALSDNLMDVVKSILKITGQWPEDEDSENQE